MATILLIDDEPSVRSVLATLLRRYGHWVLDAEDGRAALRAASLARFDLVITDIYMPGMDGIEVITKLSEMRPDVPVIAISGGGRLPKEFLLEDADLLGAVASLPKPFDVSGFMEAVERALTPTQPKRGVAPA